MNKKKTAASSEANETAQEAVKESVSENTHESANEAANESAQAHNKSIYELLEEQIMQMDISDASKAKKLSRLIKIRNQKVNIMLAGSTGAGKSSTINALFNTQVAEVGVGVEPQTAVIEKYELENLVIWDTPGLGDNVETDKRIRRCILEKLNELDSGGTPLIDLVVVILDASSKDLATSYDLINTVIIPALGEQANERILVALNQADVAMKGMHWDRAQNAPDEVLEQFLNQKADSVEKRIFEATGIKIRPIYYCAGYKEQGESQCKPYNLTKLLYYIIKAVPKQKRLAFVDNIHDSEEHWLYDDNEEDYLEGIQAGFSATVWDCISDSFEAGFDIGGRVLGVPGEIAGAAIGVVFGVVKGVCSAIFR